MSQLAPRARRLLLAALACALPFPAAAQLAVSANDAKVINVDGASVVQAGAMDTATIIDLGASPPKVIGEVKAPASVVGPPQSVAIAPDESIAVVTASTRIDPTDPKKIASDNKVTVIDLKANPPAVIATLEAGMGATGVSFNPSGTLALVANRDEGTVSIFTVSGKTLTPAGKISLGDAKSGPCHAVFLPDGRSALVTRDGDHKVSILAIDGNTVTDTKKFMVGGYRPYSIEVSPKGDVAIFGNQGGGQGDLDVINVVDLKSSPPRVVDTISVGQTPEGVGISPDGSHVAVTVMNGSQRARSHPAYNDHGLVKIYRIQGTKLSPVAEANVGRWCQGVVWSRDGKTIAVQCMVEKELQILAFDGQSLRRTGEIKVSGGPAGIRTSPR
ncbi:MAG TPA: YncE family protein [Usitatibacter sp.]|jgi:DNA-binding beta-propeller fold protein YncE|nr:YncE family protein [Usitatibacter sp.]